MSLDCIALQYHNFGLGGLDFERCGGLGISLGLARGIVYRCTPDPETQKSCQENFLQLAVDYLALPTWLPMSLGWGRVGEFLGPSIFRCMCPASEGIREP